MDQGWREEHGMVAPGREGMEVWTLVIEAVAGRAVP